MKLIGYVLVGLIALAGMFAVNRCTDKGNAAEIALWKGQKHSADSVVAVRDSALTEANARDRASVPIYIAGKDRIIRVAAGTPAAEPVRACFELADARISACEAAKQAADSVIVALRRGLKVSEAKPEPKEKRFIFFGALGYSVTADSAGTRAAPAFRVGAENKLLGPIRLVTDVQLTMPASGHASPTVQGNVFARLNF